MTEQGPFAPDQVVILGRPTTLMWSPQPHADATLARAWWSTAPWTDPDVADDISFWWPPESWTLPIVRVVREGTVVRVEAKATDNINPVPQGLINLGRNRIRGLCAHYELHPYNLPFHPHAIQGGHSVFHDDIQNPVIQYQPSGPRGRHAAFLKGTIMAARVKDTDSRQVVSNLSGDLAHVSGVTSRNSGAIAKPGDASNTIKYTTQALHPQSIVVPFESYTYIPEEWLDV